LRLGLSQTRRFRPSERRTFYLPPLGGIAVLKKEDFDLAVQNSLVATLRTVGDDSLSSVLEFAGDGFQLPLGSIPSHLPEIDKALDELFSKFSVIIKRTTIFQMCSALKLDPPVLGKSLSWMVEELRSGLWRG
jgi:hypothetical protein